VARLKARKAFTGCNAGYTFFHVDPHGQALGSAALRLAVERCLENVTVGDITAEADVSLRTFGNYFSSKYEAICAIGTDRARRTGATLLARPASRCGRPADSCERRHRGGAGRGQAVVRRRPTRAARAAAAASARAARDGLLRDAGRRVNEEEFKVPAGPGDEAERVRVHASGRVNAQAGYLKLRQPALTRRCGPRGEPYSVKLLTGFSSLPAPSNKPRTTPRHAELSRTGVNGQNHAKLPCIMRTDGGIYADCKQRHNAGDEGRGRSCR
jgi:AcrR family transcriptional regulator